MTGRIRTAVLISGNGTNLQALIDAHREPSFPADITLVVSNVAGAFGLRRAEQAKIRTLTLPHRDFASREAFDAALNAALGMQAIEFLCLAGFMRILTPGFVAAWQGRLLNIHPSLLPSFRGHDAHRQVIASSVAVSGATVHAVTAELDGGPVVGQAVVPRLADDTEDTLSARVRAAEHRLYPLAVEAYLRPEGAPLPAIAADPSCLIALNAATRARQRHTGPARHR